LIVFEQGGFSKVLEVGFVGVSEAPPEGRIKLEQRQLFESPNELAPLEFFKGMCQHNRLNFSIA
jgi:hypothetical protein